MASHSIFRKSVRLSLLFCRNGRPFGTRLLSSSAIPAVLDNGAVSYLVNSFGLSQEAAVEASHKVKLPSFEKPDSVLALLRKYEFSDAQISIIVRRRPRLIIVDAKKTLLPKLEFLSSIGISRLDLARVLTLNPTLLERSLENHIVPTYSFLKSVVVSDVKVVCAWKRSSYIFMSNLSKRVVPNIEVLRELGMPRSCIALLLIDYAGIVTRKPELFSQLVGEVKELGFDPEKTSFVHAMNVLAAKETWRRCQEAYRSWGWSDNHCVSAFRMRPLCMMLSEKKLMETMDFLVNKMGWHSHKIAKWPDVLYYSLEKRIIPRCSVVRVLVLKGLIQEESLSLANVVKIPEKYFLRNYVTKYVDKVPQLSKVYQGKLDLCSL